MLHLLKGFTKKSLIYLARVRRSNLNTRIWILVYHSVSHEKGGLNINPGLFETHMRFIKNNFDILPLSKLTNLVADEAVSQHISGNKVIITFDDGYRDNYRIAMPILDKYKIPATFFVTVGYIGKQMKDSKKSVMNWDELKVLKEKGYEIGSHTISHLNLAKLDPEQLKYEIEGSKEVIEEKLGTQVDSFAFPYGKSEHFTGKALNLIKKSGYTLACTTNGYKGVNVKQLDLFPLRRTPINGMKLAELQERLNGDHDLLLTLKDKLT